MLRSRTELVVLGRTISCENSDSFLRGKKMKKSNTSNDTSKNNKNKIYRNSAEPEKKYVQKQTKRRIMDLQDGDYFKGDVKILRKAQPGPVIFLISDGEGTIDAAIRESDFKEDEVVYISGPISERAGRLQLEIKTIEKSDFDFNTILDKKSEPARIEFSIKSNRYERMKPHFLRVAKKIRKAVMNNQPILIRHHNDSDGINSGLAIEQSIKGLMKKIGINHEYNLFRSPSRAPFYEKSDVFRDIVMSKRLINGHGQKNPLVMVLDNGSTPEDVFGMKTLKLMKYDVIVVDHHNPVILKDGKTAVCPYLLDHINPYMYGLDSQTSAGMMCYELGRMIYEEFDNPMMPAVAAISDRCNILETEEYIKNSGQTKAFLGKIGVAIDFMAYHMKFDPGKGLFEELYEKPELVNMINESVNEGSDSQLQSTMPYLRTQMINGVLFSHIDVEKYTLRFTYPTPGKVISMIHDKVAVGKGTVPVLTIGYLSDMIIIRATQPVLPVQKIIERLQKDLPEANVDGGGHECAGTIKFVPAHLSNIIERIKIMLKERRIEE